MPTPHTQQPVLAQPSHITLENKVDSVEHLQCSFGCRVSVWRHAAVRRPGCVFDFLLVTLYVNNYLLESIFHILDVILLRVLLFLVLHSLLCIWSVARSEGVWFLLEQRPLLLTILLDFFLNLF